MQTDEARAAGDARGVARDYLVLPSGGELTGAMKFVMADRSLGDEPLRFTDLALFELSGRYAVMRRLELGAAVDFLPKQPSYTDEKVWQSVTGSARVGLSRSFAFALGGSGGHLIDHAGLWTHESAMLEWKKRLDEDWLAFDVQGGVDQLGLAAPNASSATLTELGVQTSALFREPSGHWGAWIGIAYAVPVRHGGEDPTTGMAIDPQPRLDFHIGTVLALVPAWDLYVDFAVIDRGDLAMPATTLPILDGGFDQKQLTFGVTRHFKRSHRRDDDALEVDRL